MATFQDIQQQSKNRHGTGVQYYAPQNIQTIPTRSPTPTPASSQGKVADFVGNLFSGAGKVLSAVTPDFIERPATKVLNKGIGLMYSKPGSVVGDIVTSFPRAVSGAYKSKELRDLQAGRTDKGLLKGGSLFYPVGLQDIKAGINTALNPREAGITDPWSSGFSGPGSLLEQRAQFYEPSEVEKGLLFGSEVLFPTALDFGASKLVTKPLSKALRPLADAATDFARKTPSLYKPIEFFSPYFRNPEFAEMAKVSQRGTNVKVNQLYKKVKDLATGLTPEESATVGRIVEGIAQPTEITPKLQSVAQEVINMGDEVGRQLVEEGLLPAESVAKYQGRYLPHIWESILKGGEGFDPRDLPGITDKFLKRRTGATGYIQEFAPPTYYGLGTSMKNIEASKFYRNVAERFGIKADDLPDSELMKLINEGMSFADDSGIPKWRGGEQLKGYLLPDEITDYLKASNYVPQSTSWLGKQAEKIYNFWRKGKTLYNPAYHMRNIISNQFLTNMATGTPMIQTVVDWGQAVRNYFGRGNQKYVDAAEGVGLIKTKFLSENFDELLDAADIMDETVKQGLVGKVKELPRKVDNFVASFQNINEETSKLSIFKHYVDDLAAKAGKTVDEALADPTITSKAMDVAEEAIFSPYNLGRQEKEMLKWLVPFYTFTRQAVPFTVKTAINNPERLAKYPRFKAAVESLSQNIVPDEDRPEWQQGAMQLPIEYEGQPLALDTQYLLPFGNIGEGLDLGAGQLPFGLGFNPIFTYGAEALTGQEIYFDKPIAEGPLKGFSISDLLNSDPQLQGSEYVDHFLRTWMPTLYRNVKGKIYPAYQGKNDYAGRERSKAMSFLDTLFGLKLHILDPESNKQFDVWDKQTQLRELEKYMRGLARKRASGQMLEDEYDKYMDLARQRLEEILRNPE